MKLIFAVLDVSLTMGLTRCYKTEGFLHLYIYIASLEQNASDRLEMLCPGIKLRD